MKKLKKNKHNKVALSESKGDFKILHIFELRGLSNKALAGILVFALVFFVFLTQHFINPKSTGWLSYPGKMFISALSGNSSEDVKPAVAGKPFSEMRIPILMYHHVGDYPSGSDQLRKDLTVPTENFEIEVAWLKGQGYQTITLENLLNATKGKYSLPEKPVILTFDDGYDDVFLNAVPILKKYDFVGSFAIITQFPGKSYGTNVYAGWKQIADAKRQGMEIVSHTQDHFDGSNPRFHAIFISTNLKGSLQDLVKNVGSGIPPVLIYPYGHYTEEYIKVAKESGFEMALTTEFGKTVKADRLMEVPRIRMERNLDIEKFKRLIQD